MIKIEKVEICGFGPAVRGMRNSYNSWDKSDSTFTKVSRTIIPDIGDSDLKLMENLSSGGSSHAKFRRFVGVYFDITAPLYWWKEFDTYKVGTVANSCSTMHTIAAKEFELEDFSREHLLSELWKDGDGDPFTLVDRNQDEIECDALTFLWHTCDVLNHYRKLYLETRDKRYWWQMIQLLPSSYNQKRTVLLNYEVLYSIYKDRRHHKLDEWQQFCDWIETLPYVKGIVVPKVVEVSTWDFAKK